MSESGRRPIPLGRVVAPVLVLALILATLGAYAFWRDASPSCDSETIGTWHNGHRTYVLFHDFGPVSDLFVVGGNSLVWEIQAVGAPRTVPFIQLGVAPPGYKIVRSAAPYGSDVFLISASGPGGKVGAGVGSSSDPQHRAMVGGIIAGQKGAAAHCYRVP